MHQQFQSYRYNRFRIYYTYIERVILLGSVERRSGERRKGLRERENERTRKRWIREKARTASRSVPTTKWKGFCTAPWSTLTLTGCDSYPTPLRFLLNLCIIRELSNFHRRA